MLRDHTEGAALAWTHEEEGMFPPQRICCILYPCLQLQKPAAECNEEAQATFRMHMGENYQAEQLVFVNETGVNCQGTSETGNVLCPSTHGAPMYLWNGHSRG